MKVLICTPSYSPYIRGGGEISTQLLANGLKAVGVDTEVLAAFRDTQLDRVGAIPVTRIKSPNIYWSFDSKQKPAWQRAVWHIRESLDPRNADAFTGVLDKVKPDILHTSGIEDLSPGIWRVAKSRGIAVVHTLRSYTLLCTNAALFKKGRNCQTACLHCNLLSCNKRRLSSFVDAVIGISRYVLDVHLSKGYFPNAIRQVVPNIAEGVDPGSVRTKEQGSVNVAEILLPVGRRGYLGFLGRLSEEKGLEVLLAALASLPPTTRPGLLIGGWGETDYENRIRERSRGLDVQFLGKINPNELFSRIDALVVPSIWHEPLGRTVLESLTHGIPVIASNRGGIPEMIQSGDNGWLFDPDQPEQLAQLITQVFSDSQQLKRAAARCAATADRYSQETIVSRHLELYVELLKDRTH